MEGAKMITAWILLTTSALGAGEIEFGYQPVRGGGYDYMLQVQPDVVDKIRNGQTISAPLESWMHISRLTIMPMTANSRQLPHERGNLLEDERYLKSLENAQPDSRLPSDLEYGFTPTKDGFGYDVQMQLSNSELSTLARGETITKDVPEWLHMRDYRILAGNTSLKQQLREPVNQSRTARWGSDPVDTNTTSTRSNQLRGFSDPIDNRDTTNTTTASRDDLAPLRRTSTLDDTVDDRSPPTRRARTTNSRDSNWDLPTSATARRTQQELPPEDDYPPQRTATTSRRAMPPINDPRDEVGDWGTSPSHASLPMQQRTLPANNMPTTAQMPPTQPIPAEPINSTNWMVTLAALALSLGGNAYLGMIASQQRNRIWELADRFRREYSDDGPRERPSSRYSRDEVGVG
jgi:hypothetical protein